MKLFKLTADQPPKRLTGVQCDVKSCAYHDGDSYCTADRIRVGPFYATAFTDTACATYKPRTLSRSKG